MAECRKDGVDCPDFYKCTEEGDIVQNSGKKLQRFCFYCLATPRIKKIGICIKSCMSSTETSQNSAPVNGRILLHGCW